MVDREMSIKDRVRAAIIGFFIASIITAIYLKLDIRSGFNSQMDSNPITWSDLYSKLPLVFFFGLIGAILGFFKDKFSNKS